MARTPISELRGRLDGRTQVSVAAELRISVQYLCDILAGRRAMGRKVLDALGYERVVSYRPRKAESEDAPTA